MKKATKNLLAIGIFVGVMGVVFFAVRTVQEDKSKREIRLVGRTTTDKSIRTKSTSYSIGSVRQPNEKFLTTHPYLKKLQRVNFGPISYSEQTIYDAVVIAYSTKSLDRHSFEELIADLIENGYIKYAPFHASIKINERGIRENEQYIIIFDTGEENFFNDAGVDWYTTPITVKYRYDKYTRAIYFSAETSGETKCWTYYNDLSLESEEPEECRLYTTDKKK